MEIPEDEKLEKEIILKKRYTGHMRFVGEIYMKVVDGKPIKRNECT
jgi:hypothetical protein